MSYELLIEDLNINLISNSLNISNYSNHLIQINNAIQEINNNINILINKINTLSLEKLISNLRNDISGLSILLPEINIDPSAKNNIMKLLHKSENTILNYNNLALTNDFSLKFENSNKIFRVKYSNDTISNLIIYVYGIKDEIISVVENNIVNITNYITKVSYNDASLNYLKNTVNLIIKEADNYKLLLINGFSKEIMSSVNINILGNNPYTQLVGTPYVDEGATATNNLGELLNIVTTNNVNSDVLGTYQVVYHVTNKNGTEAENVRLVNVVSSV